MSCTDVVCGTGEWAGPKPGDPSNNIVLNAVGQYGGIEVSWNYPTTNPSAVAHFRLYRGTTAEFSQAIQQDVVAGSRYFDRIPKEAIQKYYYWIQLISVNATTYDPVGPASATPKALAEQTLEDLTGLIDSGVLAQALKTEIGRIPQTYAELMDEIANRIAGNAALSQALADVQSGLQESLALIYQEAVARMDGVNAVASQLNTIAAVNADNAAAILTENTARVTEDAALSHRIDSVSVASQNAAAAVVDLTKSKIGYSALSSDKSTPFDGDGSTIVYPVATYPTATYPEYAIDRKRIIDKVGVDNWNKLSVGIAKPLVWVVGLPLASSIKKVGVTDANGGYASLEQAFLTQKNLNGDFKALYTAKVDVNGLIGGFGIYNNGTTVEAGFDVDRFWIGRTLNRVKPFIISGDVVYIDKARIRTADIDTLKIAGNAVIVPTSKVFVGTYATGSSFSSSFEIAGLAAGEEVLVHFHLGAVAATTTGILQYSCNGFSLGEDAIPGNSRSYLGSAMMLGNGTHTFTVILSSWASQLTRISILTQVCKR